MIEVQVPEPASQTEPTRYNPRLLDHLPLTDTEKTALTFNEYGFAHIDRNPQNPDSHAYTLQIVKGGSGLRLAFTGDRTGQKAMTREVAETVDVQGNSQTQITDTIDSSLISELHSQDTHIKAQQKILDSFMVKAIPDYEQYWELPDPTHSNSALDAAARGNTTRLGLAGNNVRHIHSVTLLGNGGTSRQINVTTEQVTKQDRLTNTVTKLTQQAEFINDTVKAGSVVNTATESNYRR